MEAIEKHFGFRFPPDLRFLLQTALPISERFPNWRSDSEAGLRDRLDWPYDGMCFDIEHNVFWMEEWGERPGALADAFAVAREKVEGAPRLIPIFSHRYIPDEPHQEGNPVLSVYQTDIIYYGSDLWTYLAKEFHLEGMCAGNEPRDVRFWSDIASGIGSSYQEG